MLSAPLYFISSLYLAVGVRVDVGSGLAEPATSRFYVFVSTTPLQQDSSSMSSGSLETSSYALTHGVGPDTDSVVITSASKPVIDLFHTETIICDGAGFTDKQQQQLKQWEAKRTSLFTVTSLFRQELDVTEWKMVLATCTALSFMSINVPDESQPCTGIGMQRRPQTLSDLTAQISNADDSRTEIYFYGATTKSAHDVYEEICGSSCGQSWASAKYNAVTENCNYFTQTVLACHLSFSSNLHLLFRAGLSGAKTRLFCPTCTPLKVPTE